MDYALANQGGLREKIYVSDLSRCNDDEPDLEGNHQYAGICRVQASKFCSWPFRSSAVAQTALLRHRAYLLAKIS
jgi:hypothetical protein